jgi:hypothetical protein
MQVATDALPIALEVAQVAASPESRGCRRSLCLAGLQSIKP